MAHTKSSGAAKNARDSQPKYLGVKKYAGELVKSGSIVIRQRGSKFLAGEGIRRGGDDTLYAIRAGKIEFVTKRRIGFDGMLKYKKVVNVIAS